MADKWPLANGNWSDSANWNGGILPTAADDVFADGKTVTIDQDVTVLSIRTTQRSGGTAGGGFVVSSTRTITANIIVGTTTCLTCSGAPGNTVTVIGNVTASQLGVSNTYGIYITAGNNVNVTGTVTGGGVSANTGIGILHASTGTLSIIGNVNGGSGGGGNQCDGLRSTSTGAITITGNVTGGNGGSSGISNNSSATVTITGNVTGGSGSGATNFGVGNSGTLIVNGSVTSTGFLAISNSGTTTINGVCYGSSRPPFINNSTTARTAVNGDIIASSSGPFLGEGITLISSSATLTHTYRTNNAGAIGVARSLYTGGVNLNQPAVTNVRSGTVYGASNEFTGTLAVPPAGSVALGVPVDNTTGTGLINQTVLQSALEAALAPNAANIVERSTNDNKAITFSWPVSGATITGQKSIDNGAYSAVAGAITFLRTESNRHYYSLAYNAADRASVESSIRYKMTDGTYTKYFNLHVVPSGDVNVTVSPLTAEQEPRNTRSRIIVYTGEGGTQYFYAIDSAGNSLNLTGFNLELRFAKGKSVIYTAKTSNGSLTVSNNNQVTFTRSAALTRGDGELTYALRNMGAGEEVLLDGPVTVRYAP